MALQGGSDGGDIDLKKRHKLQNKSGFDKKVFYNFMLSHGDFVLSF